METNKPEVRSSEVPAAIKRARAAFLRDFPKLIADPKTRGRYVCYQDENLIFAGKDYLGMFEEVDRRKLPLNTYIIFQVQPGEDEYQQLVYDEADINPVDENREVIRPQSNTICKVPEAIKRARAAFLRDFPKLIADRKTRGRYVCYLDENLIFAGKDYLGMFEEVDRRKLPLNTYIIFQVQPGEDEYQQLIADEADFDAL
jgi:hypothetical protein